MEYLINLSNAWNRYTLTYQMQYNEMYLKRSDLEEGKKGEGERNKLNGVPVYTHGNNAWSHGQKRWQWWRRKKKGRRRRNGGIKGKNQANHVNSSPLVGNSKRNKMVRQSSANRWYHDWSFPCRFSRHNICIKNGSWIRIYTLFPIRRQWGVWHVVQILLGIAAPGKYFVSYGKIFFWIFEFLTQFFSVCLLLNI